MGNARLDHYLRTQIPVYRIALSDVNASTGSTGGGIAIEMTGVANSRVKLRHIQIAKLDGLATVRTSYFSVASTGSTNQSLLAPVQWPRGESTYAGNVRQYTASPSPGTLVGHIQQIDLSTGDVLNEHYGDERGFFTPFLNGSSESFAIEINSTSARTWDGYIEFTVEP